MSLGNNSEQYFIRRRGRVSGPFDHFVIEKMVKNSKLYKSDEISIDQDEWVTAGETEFFPKAQQRSRNANTSASDRSRVASTDEESEDASQGYGLINTQQQVSSGQRNTSIPPTNKEWYYALSDQSFGPVKESELKQQIISRAIGPKTKVWCEGMSEWEEVDQVSPFKSYLSDTNSSGKQDSQFCKSCGSKIAANAFVCTNCGVRVSNSNRNSNLTDEYSEDIYASFMQRVGAEIIDSMIAVTIAFVLYIATSFGVGFIIGIVLVVFGEKAEEFALLITILGNLAAILSTFIFVVYYYTMPIASPKMATLGKSAMGIYVCKPNGRQLRFGEAFLRFLAKSVCGNLFLGIGYLVALFTRKKQALHDLMVETVVLKHGEE